MEGTDDLPPLNQHFRRTSTTGDAQLNSGEESGAMDTELPKEAHETAFALESKRVQSEQFLIIWKAIFEYAQIAIRTIILANGAGATAILAFLGNAVAKDAKPINTLALGIATGMFALGVAAGVVATFFAYLSQYKVIRMSLDANGIVPIGAT
jgi:hypothetical protein